MENYYIKLSTNFSHLTYTLHTNGELLYQYPFLLLRFRTTGLYIVLYTRQDPPQTTSKQQQQQKKIVIQDPCIGEERYESDNVIKWAFGVEYSVRYLNNIKGHLKRRLGKGSRFILMGLG